MRIIAAAPFKGSPALVKASDLSSGEVRNNRSLLARSVWDFRFPEISSSLFSANELGLKALSSGGEEEGDMSTSSGLGLGGIRSCSNR